MQPSSENYMPPLEPIFKFDEELERSGEVSDKIVKKNLKLVKKAKDVLEKNPKVSITALQVKLGISREKTIKIMNIIFMKEK